MKEVSRTHICRCSKVCQAAMWEEHTADAADVKDGVHKVAEFLHIFRWQLHLLSLLRNGVETRCCSSLQRPERHTDVRQRANKHAHRRKWGGCRHQEALSMDWCSTCLRILRPEEGSGDTISRCLGGGIVRFLSCIEDVQCRIGPLRGIPLLAGRKWLAAIACPPGEDACWTGRWIGPG
ncbi:hypothetical protein GOODEAATRI_018692 [Goodea atripinnis]|uniref:Uncharacterized protein n=1 Tax=Goodea atripinnis TaxID=208336 RepID=A0ABV0PZ45_9TELE